MRSLGADIFIISRHRSFAAQAIRKVAELNWKPLQFVSNVSISNRNVIRPAE